MASVTGTYARAFADVVIEERLDGVMVSVSGQLKLNYVSFDQLVDPETLVCVWMMLAATHI